jgi:uncharacterized RDD family membrane protein YckC
MGTVALATSISTCQAGEELDLGYVALMLERARPRADNEGPFKSTMSPMQEPIMSQAAEKVAGPITADPYEIGWYIESADEDIYGPASRQAVRRLLAEKTITPNTLIRHCTQPESKPVAEQPTLMADLHLEAQGSAIGDKLAETWPRKSRDRLALAEASVPCAWHKRPATLMCVRCHAPYCDKCRAKPFRKQFYLCKRCQLNLYNRRAGAWILDNFLLATVPYIIALLVVSLLGEGIVPLIIVSIVQLAGLVFLFLRDSLFHGAGPGKRATGLRVVQEKDGTTPLTNGQGFVRLLSLCIPIFNLVDLSVPFRDPLVRRYGDRWAHTRVIDSPKRLEKDRAKIAKRLFKKGFQPAPIAGMTMEGFARTV